MKRSYIIFQTTYGMSETFMIGLASFGDSIEDEESRLDAKLHIKPNSEVNNMELYVRYADYISTNLPKLYLLAY